MWSHCFGRRTLAVVAWLPTPVWKIDSSSVSTREPWRELQLNAHERDGTAESNRDGRPQAELAFSLDAVIAKG